uniref:ABC transporter ATP-binding protein n=1 Tax=uncultured Thiotrichaceae bacterium TaxID=298394 RepID=A0A6S6TVI9_9GAMM|nr:MAG: ABC transporter ATP-binding protein [uncultured Thiotrichaceae bacterium]
MLDTNLLSKTFGKQQILGSCQLSLQAGERVSILGPSGIGKSTFLRIIAGLDTHYEGEVQRPENIAYMFQGPTLLDWRDCYQNLLIFHPQASKNDAQAALEQVGLGDKGLHYPRQLSLGQQRRLALARTFLSKTDLVLLDEPFTSLDPQLKTDMLELTRNLLDQSGAMLVHVTHDALESEFLGSEAIAMQGNPAKLAR